MDMIIPDSAQALRARLIERGVALSADEAERVWRDWQVVQTFSDAMRAPVPAESPE